MANIDLSGSRAGVDLRQIYDYYNGTGAFVSETTAGFTWHQGAIPTLAASDIVVKGTGLTYDATGLPTGGTITEMSYVTGSETRIHVTGISLAATDFYNFPALSGDDSIHGSAGNDTLPDGAGSDTLDGGAGIDTVSFAGRANISGHFSSGLGIDLEAGKVTIVTQQPFGTVIETDTLVSIENVIGSDVAMSLGPTGDAISGTSGSNKLWGMGGHDVLDGRGGADSLYGGADDDRLRAGAGNDLLDGGAGRDTADYSSPNDTAATGKAGAVVDLGLGESWGIAGHDRLVSIEDVTGSAGNDHIVGNGVANEVLGGFGNDVLDGRGGADHLAGDSGNDALYGGSGDDTLEAGSGVDWLAGGSGNDLIIDDATGGTAKEWSGLYGGDGNDTLQALGNGATGMHGGAGNDTFVFGAGTAYASGGSGADTFSIGADAATGPAFAQVSDFQVGIDKIAASGSVTVADWGANTGVLIVDDAGVTHTIMLMHVTADQLQHSDWLLTA